MDTSESILSDFDVDTVLREATVAEKVGLISGKYPEIQSVISC